MSQHLGTFTYLGFDPLPELFASFSDCCRAVCGEACRHRKHQVHLSISIGLDESERLAMLGPAAVVNFSKNKGKASLAKYGDADIHPRKDVLRSSAVIP